MASLLQRVANVLLGRSAYAEKPSMSTSSNELTSPQVIRAREALGGNLAPPGRVPTRLYLADVETATIAADMGQIKPAAQLMAAAKQDGVYSGVLSTRTDGLVRLPRKFVGDSEICAKLEAGHTSGSSNADPRSDFDEMCPPKELALLAADGLTLGIGVGELVEVPGRAYPVLVRLDPQFLVYLWSDGCWYYQSVAGMLPITPGDGHWVLHCPGGRVAPWQNGFWRAIARAFIRKETASLLRDNWEQKLSNAARVAEAPQAATEDQQQGWFQQVAAWGINTVFSTKPGYVVRLLESNGIGWQSYSKTIEDQDREFQICVAGQTVTTEGKSGFVSADLYKSIRSDLIQATGDDLAYTVNTQVLPAYVFNVYGEQALESRVVVMEWDTTPPKDLNSEATSQVTASTAIKGLTEALAPHGKRVDVAQLCVSFGVPILGDGDGDGANDGASNDNSAKGSSGAGDGTPVEGASAAAVDLVASQKDAEDTALNGAQIASLVLVVTQVAEGKIPRDAAIGIIKRSFLVDDATAAEMLGSVGAGFVPSSADASPTEPSAPTNTEEAAE